MGGRAMWSWVVGVVPDAEARAIPGRYVHLVRPDDWAKPAAYGETLAWWSGGGDREPFFHPSGHGHVEPTAAARRFADFVNAAHTASEAVRAMQDAGRRLMPADGPGVFVATAAGTAGPAAALCYGLGAQGSATLPGWFGDFLLDADEVRAALPRAEEALGLSGARRSEVLARIVDWMSVMGRAESGFDAAELLDAPLRVLRVAAETGSGATAFSRRH